jgi:hypothetical protein
VCPSHVDDASHKLLVVAKQAARGNRRSYDEIARLHHMHLPFTVESPPCASQKRYIEATVLHFESSGHTSVAIAALVEGGE